MSIKHYITEEEAWREIAWRMEEKHRVAPRAAYGICLQIADMDHPMFELDKYRMHERLKAWRFENDTGWRGWYIFPSGDKLLRARICRELAQEAQNG